MTQHLRIDPGQSDPGHVQAAVDALLSGGLVALPTETVYGLGGLADDPAAVARIYRAKGRPADNPLIAHVASLEAARALAAKGAWSHACETLAQLWPGPLTLVVRRSDRVCAEACAGRDTVAIRIPDHPVTLEVLRAVGRPVAAPSANPSEHLSPVSGAHVAAGLADSVDVILDDPSACRLGIESTVVDCTVKPPRVLRHGSADPTVLEELLPELVWELDRDASRAAPGHRSRHYAPDQPMHVLGAGQILCAVERFKGERVALLHRSALTALLGEAVPLNLESVPMPADPVRFGARLYGSLHGVVALGVGRILVEEVPTERSAEGRPWAAVADRLARGASPLPG